MHVHFEGSVLFAVYFFQVLHGDAQKSAGGSLEAPKYAANYMAHKQGLEPPVLDTLVFRHHVNLPYIYAYIYICAYIHSHMWRVVFGIQHKFQKKMLAETMTNFVGNISKTVEHIQKNEIIDAD